MSNTVTEEGKEAKKTFLLLFLRSTEQQGMEQVEREGKWSMSEVWRKRGRLALWQQQLEGWGGLLSYFVKGANISGRNGTAKSWNIIVIWRNFLGIFDFQLVSPVLFFLFGLGLLLRLCLCALFLLFNHPLNSALAQRRRQRPQRRRKKEPLILRRGAPSPSPLRRRWL